MDGTVRLGLWPLNLPASSMPPLWIFYRNASEDSIVRSRTLISLQSLLLLEVNPSDHQPLCICVFWRTVLLSIEDTSECHACLRLKRSHQGWHRIDGVWYPEPGDEVCSWFTAVGVCAHEFLMAAWKGMCAIKVNFLKVDTFRDSVSSKRREGGTQGLCEWQAAGLRACWVCTVSVLWVNQEDWRKSVTPDKY